MLAERLGRDQEAPRGAWPELFSRYPQAHRDVSGDLYGLCMPQGVRIVRGKLW